MTINKSRRDFITRDIFSRTARFFNEMVNSYTKDGSLEKESDYFESFETCYPLLSEAGEMLVEEAIKLGIRIEGKSKPEIAKEIFSAQGEVKNKEKGGET